MKIEKYTVERQLDDQGRLKYETWRLNGQRHRTNGPAYTRYWPDGTVKYEQWHQHGQIHRPDSPAYTSYYPDGTVEYEQWCLHDQLHRTDGPAYTSYYRPDGTVKYEQWWMHGQLLTPEQRAAQTQPTDCVLDTIVEHNGKKYRLVPVDSP